MLYPTIEELTQGNTYNRYELALATAKCARLITDEYVRQHDVAEKSQTGNKETDRPINTMIERELRDEKAVKVAIGRIYQGNYAIDREANLKKAEDAEAEADADALAAAVAEAMEENLNESADATDAVEVEEDVVYSLK